MLANHPDEMYPEEREKKTTKNILTFSVFKRVYFSKPNSRSITVYLTEHHSINIYVIAKVVAHVTASISDRSRADYDNQRCFLYRDEKGRLYNLMMGDHSAGLASTWRALLVSFSGLEAMFAITTLARIFACVGRGT